MAHSKHEAVRRRFEYRCGYCGVSETDSGGQLTVDHFRPTSQEGDDSDDNLIYACFRCNLFKSDFWPSAAEADQGYHLLNPLLARFADHFHEDPTTHLLIPQTVTGRVHLAVLQLNRAELIQYRQARWRELQRAQRLEHAETRLREVNAFLEELQNHIARLKEGM